MRYPKDESNNIRLNKKQYIVFILISILAMVIRIKLLPVETLDYKVYLENWFYGLKAGGGISALKYNIGNYNCPYIQIISILTYLPFSPLFSIKMVSIIFDYVLAASAAVLVSKIVTKNKTNYLILTYGIVLIIPTVILNSACWGQCDAIYTSFVIISLIKLIEKKYFKAICFLGLAFAFKLQFIFILPLYFLIFLSDKKMIKKIYYFFMVPVINIVLCLPSILLGRSITDVVMIYFSQTKEWNSNISSNFPNIYNLILESDKFSFFVPNPNNYFSKIMILVMGIMFLIFLILFIKKKVQLFKEDIVIVGIWSIMLSTFLLPFMHDRYIYMADILSIILFIKSLGDECTKNNKRDIFINGSIFVVIQIISLYSYIAFLKLYNWYFIDKRVISILNLLVVIYLTCKVLKIINKNNIEEEENEKRKNN